MKKIPFFLKAVLQVQASRPWLNVFVEGLAVPFFFYYLNMPGRGMGPTSLPVIESVIETVVNFHVKYIVISFIFIR